MSLCGLCSRAMTWQYTPRVAVIRGLRTPFAKSGTHYGHLSALDLGKLVRDLTATGKTAKELKDADAIVRDLTPRARERDVVLVMSNGGFGGIHQKLLDALSSR